MFIETYFISFNIAYTYSIIYSDVIASIDINIYVDIYLWAVDIQVYIGCNIIWPSIVFYLNFCTFALHF